MPLYHYVGPGGIAERDNRVGSLKSHLLCIVHFILACNVCTKMSIKHLGEKMATLNLFILKDNNKYIFTA